MSEVMSRSYQVYDFLWNENQAQFALIKELNFPEALFAIPQIKNKLDWFNLFRCKGVKLSIRLNTTAYHYGALNVSHVTGVGNTPFPDPVFGHDFRQFTRAAIQNLNNQAVLISAMTAETIDIEIPWEFPIQWIKISELKDDGREAFIAQVTFMVLDVLKMAAPSVLPIGVTIFANFIDPEVQSTTAVDAETSLAFAHAARAQSSEIMAKTDVLSTVIDGFESAVGGAMRVVDLVGSTAESTINRGLNVVDRAADMAPKVAEAAAMAAVVLDKPTLTQVPQIIQSKGGYGSYFGYGADNTAKLALHPDAQTSSDPSLSTVGLNPTIMQIIQTPGYSDQFSWSDTDAAETRVAEFRVAPYKYVPAVSGPDAGHVPTYLAFVAQNFRYWRGSMIFHFHFFASKFTSTRIRIAFLPGVTSGVAPPTGPGGDIPSIVLDITGDAHVSFAVPYIASTVFKEIQPLLASTAAKDASSVGKVVIDIINPIVSVTPGQSVSCYTWQSAGNDMQFAHFVGYNDSDHVPKLVYPIVPLPPADGQAAVNRFVDNVQPIVDGMSATKLEGYADSESFADFISLGKRYSNLQNFPPLDSNEVVVYSGFDPEFKPDTQVQSIWPNDMIWLLVLFKWCRGSWRYRMIANEPCMSFCAEYGDSVSPYIESGIPSVDFSVELPYFQKTTFVRSLQSRACPGMYNYKMIALNGSLPGNLQWQFGQVSFGDDFGVSGMFSPPMIIPRPLDVQDITSISAPQSGRFPSPSVSSQSIRKVVLALTPKKVRAPSSELSE